MSQLAVCSINDCIRYKRNCRDRNTINVDEAPTVLTDIIDKIHCYFLHTYDIGYGLSLDEQRNINNVEEEKKHSNSDLDLVNRNIQQLQKVLLEKRHNNGICSSILKNFQKKNEYKIKQIIDNVLAAPIDDTFYSFGINFKYGYDTEFIDENEKWLAGDISKKYTSLKEELTCNKISVIAMVQFNHECKKAKIHFQSQFCKKTFFRWTEADVFSKRTVLWELSVELLLSLIIYCNFTELQYKFSKTYR
eukprot:98098_1